MNSNLGLMKNTPAVFITLLIMSSLTVINASEPKLSNRMINPEEHEMSFPENIYQREKPGLIRPSKCGSHFVNLKTGQKFMVWGFNYDHDTTGRLLEDYWVREWDRVERDFKEMKYLGANVVRIHLQLSKFMKSAEAVDEDMLAQLGRLLKLSEQLGLYLNITGLGCYHKNDVPEWYDAMNETNRWAVQSFFWEAISKACRSSSAVFCYDLMNEPILPGLEHENEWLHGELDGKYYIQRITLDLAGRNSSEIARIWINKMVDAIRKYDKRHMITVGEISLAYSFPGAKSLFHSDKVGKSLDFVSVHFYPKKDDLKFALKSLAAYNLGKPLVIEEIFPLFCDLKELDSFIEGSRRFTDGWIGFYWGNSQNDLNNHDNPDTKELLIRDCLKYFKGKAHDITKN